MEPSQVGASPTRRGVQFTSVQARWWVQALCLALGFLVAASLFSARSHGVVPVAAAQSADPVWSEPINLSNSVESSDNPAIVADQYGYVHVFWSEEVGGRPLGPNDQHRPGNTIFYRRWDGTAWTAPLDILFVPDESIAEFVAVSVDARNELHAVWTGQTSIYYSHAPAAQADSARNWITPIVVATDSARSQWESDVLVDSLGDVHVFYATRSSDPGVYQTISRDDGASWEVATRISLPLDTLEQGFANVRAFMDPAGRLHLVWQTYQEEGFGQAVYYARSTDSGDTWSVPVQLGYRDPGDFEASYPYLATVSDSQLQLVYEDGNIRGRFQRISLDSGATWSEPFHIIDEMEGVNGYVIPLVDRDGGMHLVINMRSLDQVVGIYYARWQGNGWSRAVPVDNKSPGSGSAHHAAATVRLGNELHVVYNQLLGGEIWYVRGVVPDVTPAVAAVPPPAGMPQALSTPSPVPTVQTPEVTRTSVVARPAQVAPDAASAPPRLPPILIAALIPSLGSAALLLVGAIVWRTLRSRSSHRS